MGIGNRRQRLLVIIGLFLFGLYFHSKTIASGQFNLWTGRASGSKWRNTRLRYPKKINALPHGTAQQLPRVQADFGTETEADRTLRQSRQHAVGEAFMRSWQSYKRLAWKADELTPISGTPKNNYGGWGASLVDNLDTLWIMGHADEFEAAVSAAAEIEFDTSSGAAINVFETTIRYLGGFLSAFDLSGDKRLLHKAIELGDMLLIAFDTPNGMPIMRWSRANSLLVNNHEASENTLLAEIGSLSLEFTHLAQLTGDNRYYSAIERITTFLAMQQNDTALPGLWPIIVDARAADFTSSETFTLGGMADSAYEYLPKMHALMGGTDPRYRSMYTQFSTTALKHMIRPFMAPDSTRNLLVSVDAVVETTGNVFLREQGQHLVCFLGGLFALAGRLLSLPEHVDVGRRLTDGCLWAYRSTATGVMPERYFVATCAPGAECKWDEAAWRDAVAKKAGYTGPDRDTLDEFIATKRLTKGFTSIPDRRYVLRPETIESVFVMYRVTGERRWMDEAWALFEAITAASRTELANGEIMDVTVDKARVEIGDSMESFWMAETLKYFYLIFSEPTLISLDEFVFNTEAHPLRRPVKG